MTYRGKYRIGSLAGTKMARIMVLMMAVAATGASNLGEEGALANITRFAAGDLFSLTGTDCGPTRCMEVSHGTALAALGPDGGGGDGGCVCQCRRDTPAFREDQRVCVNHIDECLMASFGRGATKPQIPFVYLPMKGQIIYPAKEIIFTDVEDAICAVTSAQYLSSSGWVTLRDLIDNDVPFGLYRDEGSTFLQWRGSAALHARLEGRLLAAHVMCSAGTSTRLAASCAAFRVAGASTNALLDVRSIPFHAGEIMTTETASQNQGLSVLEALAIGVCVLLLIFVYAAGIIFYVHYKQKQKRKQKDPEQNISGSMSSDDVSPLDSRIDLNNVMLKTNPLMSLDGMSNDYLNDAGLSDVSERTEDTLETSPKNTNKFQKLNTNVISAMVHSRRKKPVRPSIRTASTPERMNERLQRRSVSPDTLERAPHSDLSIVDCSVENNFSTNRKLPSSNGDNTLRKKLYFNPVFFETEHLKNPPPAAIEFLMKIREVMSVAKEKMTAKRFIPILSDIPEEDFYHAIDLGWDIPCARRGRRFSAISLKQENSRKSVHCGGCPGCDSNARPNKAIALTRSNSCKSCVSEDYKQRIVRKWLDEVPMPISNTRPVKSVAKVSGTPRVIESKKQEEVLPIAPELIRDHNTRPKVTETFLNENVREQSIKDIKIVEQVKVNNNVIKQKEEIQMNQEIETKINNYREPEIKVLKNLDIEVKIRNESDIGTSKLIKPRSPQGKKSPSSHTSRRIRKKLPPPPPPPPMSPPDSIKVQEEEPIPLEVKVKMEAVIRELNNCRRVEPIELEEVTLETIVPIAPKIVIPVLAADSHYFSDDNTLSRKKETYVTSDNFMDFDSLERSIMKRRRFSVACGPELYHNPEHRYEFCDNQNLLAETGRLTSSWCHVNKAVDESELIENRIKSEVFVDIMEPVYNNVDEISNHGPLTIQVRGSPIENRRNDNKDDFDPDTLDRRDTKKRVEKILLKSAGSFKHKSTSGESEPNKKSPVAIVTQKIGNLREIYEAKAKAQEEEMKYYNRRGSITFGQDLSSFMKSVNSPDLLRHIEGQKDPKPPIPPKQRRGSDVSPKFSSSTRESPPGDRRRMSEERDRFPQYTRADNLNARRSGRRSARTRSRRTDLRKLYRTEDSGYMSTDSNESKRRARYLMQLKPPTKTVIPEPIPLAALRSAAIKTPVTQMESDTDDLESLCDGRSESGGESVETDSVFFGNFDDTKELFAELGLDAFEAQTKLIHAHEQIDSGFVGETNIILSGDSDSEHRSVISIMTGRDGRASAASLSKLDDAPYLHTIEC